MATIARKLPASNPKRKLALDEASKKQSAPGPIGSVLTAATANRLGVIQPQFLAATNWLAETKALSIKATANKNVALKSLRLIVKHFIGVFNFGIERGLYSADQRAYFGIDADNANLPDLSTEAAVEQLAQAIVQNDGTRVANGGAPMMNPSMADVQANLIAYDALKITSNNARDTLDLAQEALQALVPEADAVIKKVWDEAETFFNEEDDESRRNNCRQWGVMYLNVGDTSRITLTLREADNPEVPITDATVTQLDTGVVRSPNARGEVVFETTLFGPDMDFLIESDTRPDKTVTLNWEQGQDVSQVVLLQEAV